MLSGAAVVVFSVAGIEQVCGFGSGISRVRRIFMLANVAARLSARAPAPMVAYGYDVRERLRGAYAPPASACGGAVSGCAVLRRVSRMIPHARAAPAGSSSSDWST